MVLGGPLPHAIAAKAVALQEASQPEFQTYAHRIVENAQVLAEGCIREGISVLTGGTDNHLMLLDVTESFGLTGRQAETALRDAGITLNRNALPFDPNGPWYTSGLRVGTPAVTTLGMGADEMREIAAIIKLVLASTEATIVQKGEQKGSVSKARFRTDAAAADQARQRVEDLLKRHPLYPSLDPEILELQATG
jgi:glycine hydroxymethyltransferase